MQKEASVCHKNYAGKKSKVEVSSVGNVAVLMAPGETGGTQQQHKYSTSSAIRLFSLQGWINPPKENLRWHLFLKNSVTRVDLIRLRGSCSLLSCAVCVSL